MILRNRPASRLMIIHSFLIFILTAFFHTFIVKRYFFIVLFFVATLILLVLYKDKTKISSPGDYAIHLSVMAVTMVLTLVIVRSVGWFFSLLFVYILMGILFWSTKK